MELSAASLGPRESARRLSTSVPGAQLSPSHERSQHCMSLPPSPLPLWSIPPPTRFPLLPTPTVLPLRHPGSSSAPLATACPTSTPQPYRKDLEGLEDCALDWNMGEGWSGKSEVVKQREKRVQERGWGANGFDDSDRDYHNVRIRLIGRAGARRRLMYIDVGRSEYVPYYTTYWTTWGVTQTSVIAGSVTTVSVYEDASTTITLTPNAVTYTLFPTVTYIETSTIVQSNTAIVVSQVTVTQYSTATAGTVVIPTTVSDPDTTTSSSISPPTATSTLLSSALSSSISKTTSTKTSATQIHTSIPTVARFSECLPGDSRQKKSGDLSPTQDQTTTLYIVGITIGWSLFAVRHLLYPFKTLIVAVHELGHFVGFAVSGEPVLKVTIDPTIGGGTFIVIWFCIWLAASFIILIAFVLAALATWRETPHGMYCQSQTFLPT
ncbi:hypothetical protein P7C70_g4308, partial [Phenoliferia sp. Uapishka_3]